MKLLLCTECADVRKLNYHDTFCDCGRSVGRYLADGAHAVHSGPSIVLGLDNRDARKLVHGLAKRVEVWRMDPDDPGVRVRREERLP